MIEVFYRLEKMKGYSGFWLEGKYGNNAFAREKREKSEAKLRVAPLISGNIDQLCIGEKAVFAEEDEYGEVKRYFGLQNFLFFELLGVPIYVFDNHNHALAFWYEELRKGAFGKGIRLLHIDQHSDMKENPFSLIGESEDEVFDFMNYRCNVGNFIVPALSSGLVSEVEQIRSERGLFHTQIPEQDYILDIDLDFWAPEMGIEDLEVSFEKVKSLMEKAKMVTIATSPYFLDQHLALKLLRQLFDNS